MTNTKIVDESSVELTGDEDAQMSSSICLQITVLLILHFGSCWSVVWELGKHFWTQN